jgi:hypothetical protein
MRTRIRPSWTAKNQSFDTPGMESDSLYGYGATELLMNKLLAQEQAPA